MFVGMQSVQTSTANPSLRRRHDSLERVTDLLLLRGIHTSNEELGLPNADDAVELADEDVDPPVAWRRPDLPNGALLDAHEIGDELLESVPRACLLGRRY
jgi:hypothetical protein